MTYLSYRLYRFLSLSQYWIERRFTKAGLLVFCGIFLMMGLAVDTEQSAAYQLLGIVLALLLSAMAWAPFFRGRFSIERHLPRFGTVNQPLAYAVTVTNLASRAERELTLLEDLQDTRPSASEFALETKLDGRSFRLARSRQWRRATRVAERALTSIRAKGSADVSLELTPLRRGPLRWKGATMARPDPLGLFRGFVHVSAPQSILILPKRYLLRPIALPGASKYQQGGVALAGSVGESEEFVSLREYRRGDPLRHIHWKSSAKAGEPVVKEFQDEFFVRHALILDTFAGSEKGEAFEEAVAVAASFAATIDTQDSLLDLMFVGPQAFRFTAGRGVAHSEQMLEILASVSLCPSKEFRSLQELVLEHTTALSGCICIFLAWDAPRRDLVRRLRQLDLPLLVLVVQDVNEGAPLDLGPLQNQPEYLHSLHVGHVAEGLQRIT